MEWNTTSGETGAEANQCQVLTLGTGRQYMPRDRKIGYLNGRWLVTILRIFGTRMICDGEKSSEDAQV